MTRLSSQGPILVIGGSGMLGRALLERLESTGQPHIAPGRDRLDLVCPESIEPEILDADPSAIVNAAAYTDVGGAEKPTERDRVERLNGSGPAEIARVAAKLGRPLVHVSTDYVFDGSSDRPYREDDPVGPLQEYGRSKLAGERAVAAACPGAIIARTSTLYGPGPRRRPHYVDAIRAQASGRDPIRVVRLPISSPTYAPDLALGILELLAAGAHGVVHLVNRGECSRLELARATVELCGEDPGRVEEREPPAADLARPAYSVLSTERFREWVGHPPRAWRVALEEYLTCVSPSPA